MKAGHFVVHDGDAHRVVAGRNITVQHIALLAVSSFKLWCLSTAPIHSSHYALGHTAMWR
jgi:hypothetical protein